MWGRHHFETKCKSSSRKPSMPKRAPYKPKHGKANLVTSSDTVGEDEPQYAFTCTNSKEGSHRIKAKIGGVDVHFIVDSGSDCNLISQRLRDSIKSQHVRCKLKRVTKTLSVCK